VYRVVRRRGDRHAREDARDGLQSRVLKPPRGLGPVEHRVGLAPGRVEPRVAIVPQDEPVPLGEAVQRQGRIQTQARREDLPGELLDPRGVQDRQVEHEVLDARPWRLQDQTEPPPPAKPEPGRVVAFQAQQQANHVEVLDGRRPLVHPAQFRFGEVLEADQSDLETVRRGRERLECEFEVALAREKPVASTVQQEVARRQCARCHDRRERPHVLQKRFADDTDQQASRCGPVCALDARDLPLHDLLDRMRPADGMRGAHAERAATRDVAPLERQPREVGVPRQRAAVTALLPDDQERKRGRCGRGLVSGLEREVRVRLFEQVRRSVAFEPHEPTDTRDVRKDRLDARVLGCVLIADERDPRGRADLADRIHQSAGGFVTEQHVACDRCLREDSLERTDLFRRQTVARIRRVRTDRRWRREPHPPDRQPALPQEALDERKRDRARKLGRRDQLDQSHRDHAFPPGLGPRTRHRPLDSSGQARRTQTHRLAAVDSTSGFGPQAASRADRSPRRCWFSPYLKAEI